MNLRKRLQERKERKEFDRQVNDLMKLGYREFAVQRSMDETFRALGQIPGSRMLEFDYQLRFLMVDIDGVVIRLNFKEIS